VNDTTRTLPEAEPQVIGDDGQFHAQDQAVDLSGTTVEGWVALAIFWMLGVTVFYQFFTRYVLNDSAAWTEEIARYLLIGVVFVGASVGVARNTHIHVDFLYRFLPARAGRWLALTVDVLRVLFFVVAVVLTGLMMDKLGNNSRMTMIDLPMNIVYAVCLAGFAAMAWRSVQVMLVHWRRGYSVLERPETTITDR
jgi:TRAP-type C4-dicarboxylate transport system permease small subunit